MKESELKFVCDHEGCKRSFTAETEEEYEFMSVLHLSAHNLWNSMDDRLKYELYGFYPRS